MLLISLISVEMLVSSIWSVVAVIHVWKGIPWDIGLLLVEVVVVVVDIVALIVVIWVVVVVVVIVWRVWWRKVALRQVAIRILRLRVHRRVHQRRMKSRIIIRHFECSCTRTNILEL